MTLISRNFFEKFLFLFIFLDVVAVLSSQAREKLSFWRIGILERASQKADKIVKMWKFGQI